MRKFFKLSFLLFIIILSSCSHSGLSKKEVSVIENEDNNICIKKENQLNKQITDKKYWNCRLRVVEERIKSSSSKYNRNSVAYNNELKRIKKEIEDKIKLFDEKNQKEVQSLSEEKEHEYCLLLLDKENITKNRVFNYNKCRDKIKYLKYNKDNYSDLTNETIFEIFKINEKLEISKESSVILIQNECVKYASSIEKLEKCEIALEKISKCSLNIKNTLEQRKIDDIQFCRKISIEKYPDSLAKFNNNLTIQSNTTNISGNLGPKMNKSDIVKLRQTTLQECLEERNKKLLEYDLYLKDQCRITNFKILEEK